jgi:hypothetical protein
MAFCYEWEARTETFFLLKTHGSKSQACLKLSVRVYKYVELGGFAKFGYRHKHYLTNANPGTAGYIEGLDSENTPWVGSGVKSKYGGRLLAEEYFVLDWGVNLKLLF